MGSLDPQVLDILGYVGLGFGIFYALIILFSVFKGYRRGVIRQSIRTGTILLSIIASIVAIKVFVGMIDDAFDGNTLEVALNTLLEPAGMSAADLDLGEEMAVVLEMDAMIVRDVALTIIAPILFPIVFTILFIVISFVLYILYAIVMLFIRKLRKKNNTKKTRWLGALVGLVQGIIVAAIFFLPFTNLFDMADETIEVLADVENEDIADAVEMIEELEAPIYNFPMKMSTVLGGKMFANIVATIDLDGESYNTREFLPNVAGLAVDAMGLTEVDFMNLTEDNKTSIKGVVDDLLNEPLFANVIIEVFSMFSDLVEENEDMMDIPPEMQELFDAFFDFLKIDKADENAKDILKANFNTFIDVLFIITDSGIIDAVGGEDEDAIFDALTAKDANGDTIIDRIIATLKSNSYTADILNILAKLSVGIMAEQAGLSDEVTHIYELVEDNFADNLDALNAADSAEDVAPILKNILDVVHLENEEISVEIDDETYQKMAEIVYDEFLEDADDLTEADLADIIFTYYEAMLDEVAA